MISWYVIHSKPRNEDLLCEQLCIRDIESFYPRVQVHTVNPRARKIQPYFPGYIFIHIDLCIVGTSPFEWMPGALGIVSFGNEPAYVPDGLIQIIRQRVDQLNETQSETKINLQRGDRVFIHDGVFAGHEAIFDAHMSGTDRVRVLLSLLNNRQIPLELSTNCICTNQH
jgi:transcription elongation factor/antiterminator RfaH